MLKSQTSGDTTLKRSLYYPLLALSTSAILLLFLSACSELNDLRYIKAAQDTRIKELSRDIETRSGEYKKALTQKQYEIDSLNKRLAAVRDEMTRVQTQLAERQRAFEIESRKATDNQAAAQKDIAALRATVDGRTREIEAVRTDLSTTQADAAAQKSSVESLAKKLAAAQEELEELKARAKSSDESLKEKDRALASARKDLEAARKRAADADDEATATDTDFQDALSQLKARLDPVSKAGFASVFADSRGVVVRLSADYLFKPGQVDLDPAVLPTLDAIGETLTKFPSKYVDVEGHTDSQPIVNLPFSDNWALAATRANKVVRYLAEQGGVDPRRLKSVSCSQYRPMTGKGASDPQNQRRVEIVVRSRP
jgi:flagellar motor protein MotB